MSFKLFIRLVTTEMERSAVGFKLPSKSAKTSDIRMPGNQPMTCSNSVSPAISIGFTYSVTARIRKKSRSKTLILSVSSFCKLNVEIDGMGSPGL